MRRWIPVLVIAALLPSLAAGQSVQELYSDAQGFLGEAEGREVPEPLDQIFVNERINVHVEDTDIVVGAVIEDGEVTEVMDGALEDPTVNVYVTKEGIQGVASGEMSYRELIRQGHIRIVGVGPFNAVKFTVLSWLLKAGVMLA